MTAVSERRQFLFLLLVLDAFLRRNQDRSLDDVCKVGDQALLQCHLPDRPRFAFLDGECLMFTCFEVFFCTIFKVLLHSVGQTHVNACIVIMCFTAGFEASSILCRSPFI